MANTETKEVQTNKRSSWFTCCRKDQQSQGDVKMMNSNNKEEKKKQQPGGWKTMPFIIGNETIERLAQFGLLANFLVYLKREYHQDQVAATNFVNIYSGVANFAPLLGAFISDAYIGRFWAIAIGSVASFLGMMVMTLTAWVPNLRPPPCPYNNQQDQSLQQNQLSQCEKPDGPQILFLVLSLALLCMGTAGIRPCSLPFGIDQFDHTTEEGRKGISSFFNWYYATFSVAVMLTLTVVVYIQDSVSWIVGFGIPTILMLCSIILFFIGKHLYVYVKPGGSVFTSIFRVFVAAYKKRGLTLPALDIPREGLFYDPPTSGVGETKLPMSAHFSFLNKGALIQEGEINMDGNPTPKAKWTLCSIQDIEEVKCLIRVLPIWASGIIAFTAAHQQSTFTVSQAMAMNRHIGPKFLVPPGSIVAVSMLTVGLWIPIYDRFLVPALRKMTKHADGITLLQRMGIGLVFSILSMIIAGLVEEKRRTIANDHHEKLSIAWLIPQLVMLGFAEAFNFIGQIEFYNKQFPKKLSSVATSLFFCTVAGASYLSAAVVNVVHHVTGGHGKPDWLTNDINQGKLDYFYYLLAIMGSLNLVYFLVVAKKYRYKDGAVHQNDLADVHQEDLPDVELNLIKSTNDQEELNLVKSTND